MRRKLLIAATVVGVCLGVVVTRAVWEGRSALAKGDAAQAAGDTTEAITWWRRAARWYVPIAPHVSSAYERLQNLAQQAEAKSDRVTALAAWRGIRGSILATRSFFVPHAERLGPANRHIAALMAKSESATVDPGKTEQQRADWHYALLARDEAPSVFWSVIAIFGFGLWVGGGVVMALRGVSREDTLVVRQAAYAGGMVLSGLVIWVLGLYYA